MRPAQAATSLIARLVIALLFIALLPACESPGKKEPRKPAVPRTMPDKSKDVSFQSFLGRLRTSVEKKDVAVLASMMTPNFGYSLSPELEGKGVFEYWDKNGLWEELKLVVKEEWAPYGNFMVAPAQFASGADYRGYRAGVLRVGGSWKFAYFVTD